MSDYSKSLFWFTKYIKSRSGLWYSDLDLVDYCVKVEGNIFRISNGYIERRFSGGRTLKYSFNEFVVAVDKKYLHLFDKDTGFLRVKFIVMNEVVSCNRVDRDGYIYYSLNTENNVDMDKYRLNIIKNGDKYSLKGSDLASYLYSSILKFEDEIVKYLESRGDYFKNTREDFIIQEALRGFISVSYKGYHLEFAFRDLLSDGVKDGMQEALYELLMRVTETGIECDTIDIDLTTRYFKGVYLWYPRGKGELAFKRDERANIKYTLLR